MRRRGSHIFQTIGSQKAVRSALRSGRTLPSGRFLVHISVLRDAHSLGYWRSYKINPKTEGALPIAYNGAAHDF
jgi:hypothetical protein